MAFFTENMFVNKILLTPGSTSLKISHMNAKKIDKHALSRLTTKLTKELIISCHGLSAYNLMPLLAEIVMRLNLLEDKEPTALPDSLNLLE